MRKVYYVYYPRSFANEYSLRWVWDNDRENKLRMEAAGCIRITKRRAMELVHEEKDRKKYNQSGSGYADEAVLPWYWQEDMWYQPYEAAPTWPYFYCKNNIVGKIDEI